MRTKTIESDEKIIPGISSSDQRSKSVSRLTSAMRSIKNVTINAYAALWHSNG